MDSEHLFNEVIRTVSKWSPKGEKLLSNDVRLICPTPHVGPEAWLHVLFPPLAPEKIEEMEKVLGVPLPDNYKGFLLRANGLMLFNYRISVFGLRKDMARRGDEGWQPHDLTHHNYETERPAGSPDNVVYFGSAPDGASWCFFEFDDESYRVGKTDREHFYPASYWSDFDSWLLDEMRSSEMLYNSNGEMVTHDQESSDGRQR